MSVGWGGKQPLMKQTAWCDAKGKKHVQDVVFTGKKGEKKTSSCSGRKKNKKDPDPSHVGQAKGLHQVLWERGLVPGVLTPSQKLDPTSCEGRTILHLEAEGRMGAVTQNAADWADTCGCLAPPDDFPVGASGCDGGAIGKSGAIHLNKGCDGGVLDREDNAFALHVLCERVSPQVRRSVPHCETDESRLGTSRVCVAR
jgi:hypothetical protein